MCKSEIETTNTKTMWVMPKQRKHAKFNKQQFRFKNILDSFDLNCNANCRFYQQNYNSKFIDMITNYFVRLRYLML